MLDTYRELDPPEIPKVPPVDPTVAVELEMAASFSHDSVERTRNFLFVQLPIVAAGGLALAQLQASIGAQILLVPIAGFAMLQTKQRYLRYLIVVVLAALLVHPHILTYTVPILASALFAECLAESYLRYATGAPFPAEKSESLRKRLENRTLFRGLLSAVFPRNRVSKHVFRESMAIWLTYDPGQKPGVQPARFGTQSDRVLVCSTAVICLGALFWSPIFQLLATGVADAIQNWLVAQIGHDGRPPGVARNMNLILGAIFVLPLPVIFLVGFSTRYAAPVFLAAHLALCEARNAKQEDQHAAIVERLDKSSKHNLHFIGLGPTTHAPNVLPIEIYSELSWLYGPMGSGKTTALNQVSERLISCGCSLSFLDLKGGSNEAPETLRLACEKHGIPFKVFSPSGLPSHILNPFRTDSWQGLAINERVETILRMFGVSHDRSEWGKGFFTTANEILVEHALVMHPNISNFNELSQALSLAAQNPPSDLPRDLVRAGSHIVGAVRRFSRIEVLNATEKTHGGEAVAASIDFANSFKSQEVHFYQLPAARLGSHAAELARLICNGYPASAEQIDAKKRRKLVVIVDEFHCLDSGEGRTLESFLTQSRSLDIGVILANQTPGQITNPRIATNVINGTRFRQCFGLGPDDLLVYEGRSGRRIEDLRGIAKTYDGISVKFTEQVSESIQPYININELRQITADPTLSVCELVRGTKSFPTNGLPWVNRSLFSVDEREYERRKFAPWALLPGMIKKERPFDADRRPERWH